MKKRKVDQETFKKKVQECCKHLRWHFYANAYRMSFEWFLDEYKAGPEGKTVTMEIQIVEDYLNFTIKVYKNAYDIWKDRPDLFFESLVHEFCHLVTDPLFQEAHRYAPLIEHDRLYIMRERTTSLMQQIICGDQEDQVYKLEKILK